MLDRSLVDWIEEKTKMDFDSRLSVLASVALGQEIDKKSDLWNKYKLAKKIRNKVTHIGQRVTESEAKTVLKTVHEWLSLLGSRLEVDMALQELKMYLESQPFQIEKEQDAVKAVTDYFRDSSAFSSVAGFKAVTEVKLSSGSRPDVVLTFGDEQAIIEVKLVRSSGGLTELLRTEQSAIYQVEQYLNEVNITRGSIVLFTKFEIPVDFQTLRRQPGSRVSTIVVQIGDLKNQGEVRLDTE